MTEKQVISKLLEFTESELKFKQIHEQYKEKNVLKDFEGTFRNLFTDSVNNAEFTESSRWYSPIADFDYPRVLHQQSTRVGKNNRYHLPFLHIHDFYEFVYILRGECYQSIDKKRFLSKKGEFYYVAPGSIHSIYSCDDNAIVVNLCVLAADMETIFCIFNGKNKIINENIALLPDTNKCSYMKFKDKDGFIYSSILNLYKHIFENEKNMTPLTVAALIEILSACDDGNLIEETEKSNPTSNMVVYEIIEYVRKNFKTVTLNEISEKFHFTSNYMSRMIKKETGKTFKEILNGIKVAEAYKLLLTTKLRVIDIAYEVGFNSQEHFTRTFEKYMSIAPTQIRKGE